MLPAPAQTYLHQVQAVLRTASGVAAPTPKVIHIRQDGGTNGQCHRTANAPYPGKGTGLHCAWTKAVRADPLFVSESNIDAINPALRSSSPAAGLGASLTPATQKAIF